MTHEELETLLQKYGSLCRKDALDVVTGKGLDPETGKKIVDVKTKLQAALTRTALTPNVPTEPGRYRMTMEVDVEMFPGTDACFTVWHGSEPIGSVGSINNEKYDITAHFERIKEES